MENGKEYVRHKCGKVSPDFGRALQGNCYRGCGSILLGGSRREAASLTIECPQSKKVLSMNCWHTCMLSDVKQCEDDVYSC